MGKIVATIHMTLDGFVSGPNDDMSIFHPLDPENTADNEKVIYKSDYILFGRVTYEGMRPYWTTTTGDMAHKINTTPKLVLSKTLNHVEWGQWNNAELVNSTAQLNKMKEKSDGIMAIFGSANLIQSLSNEGLIDVYRIQLQPIVIGHGRPLFKNIKDPIKLNLLNEKTYGTGVKLLEYEFVK